MLCMGNDDWKHLLAKKLLTQGTILSNGYSQIYLLPVW